MKLLRMIARYFGASHEPFLPKDLGRNDDCWCGSGRKYKKCHLAEDEKKLRPQQIVRCGST